MRTCDRACDPQVCAYLRPCGTFGRHYAALHHSLPLPAASNNVAAAYFPACVVLKNKGIALLCAHGISSVWSLLHCPRLRADAPAAISPSTRLGLGSYVGPSWPKATHTPVRRLRILSTHRFRQIARSMFQGAPGTQMRTIAHRWKRFETAVPMNPISGMNTFDTFYLS
jgi:hypothetical protein